MIAYANSGFWDSADGPRDADLAAELEWMVPRYPTKQAPPKPADWGSWILGLTSKRPQPPKGADWSGWQFSADGNEQGPVYGCSSRDLDLNIVHADAWQRWTTRDGTIEPVGSGAGSEPASSFVALTAGRLVHRGDARASDDGSVRLVHLDNGDVVVQHAVWSAGTAGEETSSLNMQPDGNLVLYAADKKTPLWSSGTAGNEGAELQLGPDGPAIVAADGRQLWP